MTCIFCDIIAGNEPSHKIYEDDLVIAFLVLRPIRKGHCLVIPKQHIENFIDLPDTLAAHIATVGNIVGRKLKALYSPLKVGVVVSGFGVAHAHYHIIPLYDKQDISSSAYVRCENNELIFGEFCSLVDPEELDKTAAEIISA